MLRQKSLQNPPLHAARVGGIGIFHIQAGRRLDLRGEIGPVAQMPPATHHGQVHAGASALHFHSQDVDIAVGHVVHRLLVQHIGQRRDLVAQFRRLLKLQPLSVRHHARFQFVQYILCVALQKALRIDHVQGVIRRADMAHARAGAAFDLVQQTGTGAVGENRVLAGAQAEHLLHQQHRLFDRPGTGVRSKIVVFLLDATAVIGHTREMQGLRAGLFGLIRLRIRRDCRSHLQVGVALVIPKQDVVLGLQRLDQVVFQQQRLGFGAHHGGLHAHNLAHHVADAGAAMVFLEVAGDPLFQAVGFAHVQQSAIGVEIAVHARQIGQAGNFVQQSGAVGAGVRHGAYCAGQR